MSGRSVDGLYELLARSAQRLKPVGSLVERAVEHRLVYRMTRNTCRVQRPEFAGAVGTGLIGHGRPRRDPLRPKGSRVNVHPPLQGLLQASIGGGQRRQMPASGQPFDHAALERQNWVYDTELGAIAVVTMRHLDPTATFGFFTRLQRAFYAENVDITDPVVYPDLLDGFVVDRGSFLTALASPEMKQAAWQDFEMARRLSVTGFPSLLLRLGEEHLVVTRGYLGWETLEPALTGWMREQFGAEADTLLRPKLPDLAGPS